MTWPRSEGSRPTNAASAGESVRMNRRHAAATLLLAATLNAAPPATALRPTTPSPFMPPLCILPPAAPPPAAPPPVTASSGSAVSKASAWASRAAHWTVAASALPDAPGTATASAAAASHAALSAASTHTSRGAATARRAYSGDGRKQRACVSTYVSKYTNKQAVVRDAAWTCYSPARWVRARVAGASCRTGGPRAGHR